MKEALPRLEDDGLITPEVGDWGERKYRLVANYAAMFSRAMKGKWDCRVYLDLFAGCGRARLKGTTAIVPGSPLLAATLDPPFDAYVFCEQDEEKVRALEARVLRSAPSLSPVYVNADANSAVERMLTVLQRPSRGRTVLTFCFVDPYRIGDLQFETVQKLAEMYKDFLILIPSYMDANRNLDAYLRPDNQDLDRFLGDPAWREAWRKAHSRGERFGDFIAASFGRSMSKLRFLYENVGDMVLVRSTEKNLPLYHLAFFSRSPLGAKFWQEARRYSTDQRELPF